MTDRDKNSRSFEVIPCGGYAPGKLYSLGDNNDGVEQLHTGLNFLLTPRNSQRTQEQIAQIVGKSKPDGSGWRQSIAGAICGLVTGIISGWAWIYFHGC